MPTKKSWDDRIVMKNDIEQVLVDRKKVTDSLIY